MTKANRKSEWEKLVLVNKEKRATKRGQKASQLPRGQSEVKELEV